jgi:hypothetical protein
MGVYAKGDWKKKRLTNEEDKLTMRYLKRYYVMKECRNDLKQKAISYTPLIIVYTLIFPGRSGGVSGL